MPTFDKDMERVDREINARHAVSNDEDRAAARKVVEGCTNWHEIEYTIVPRIAAALAAERAKVEAENAALRKENERLKTNLAQAKEDLRILTKGRIVQS